jgi:hypothetical protein
MKKNINAQELSNVFTFPSFEFSEEDETTITNEGEHEIEEIPQIQDEEPEIPQTQEEIEEGIEKISLLRSSRVPQVSTRLQDFVTFKVYYPI